MTEYPLFIFYRFVKHIIFGTSHIILIGILITRFKPSNVISRLPKTSIVLSASGHRATTLSFVGVDIKQVSKV